MNKQIMFGVIIVLILSVSTVTIGPAAFNMLAQKDLNELKSVVDVNALALEEISLTSQIEGRKVSTPFINVHADSAGGDITTITFERFYKGKDAVFDTSAGTLTYDGSTLPFIEAYSDEGFNTTQPVISQLPDAKMIDITSNSEEISEAMLLDIFNFRDTVWNSFILDDEAYDGVVFSGITDHRSLLAKLIPSNGGTVYVADETKPVDFRLVNLVGIEKTMDGDLPSDIEDYYAIFVNSVASEKVVRNWAASALFGLADYSAASSDNQRLLIDALAFGVSNIKEESIYLIPKDPKDLVESEDGFIF